MSDNLAVTAAPTMYNITCFHKLTIEFCDYLWQYKTDLGQKEERERERGKKKADLERGSNW